MSLYEINCSVLGALCSVLARCTKRPGVGRWTKRHLTRAFCGFVINVHIQGQHMKKIRIQNPYAPSVLPMRFHFYHWSYLQANSHTAPLSKSWTRMGIRKPELPWNDILHLCSARSFHSCWFDDFSIWRSHLTLSLAFLLKLSGYAKEYTPSEPAHNSRLSCLRGLATSATWTRSADSKITYEDCELVLLRSYLDIKNVNRFRCLLSFGLMPEFLITANVYSGWDVLELYHTVQAEVAYVCKCHAEHHCIATLLDC